MRTRRLLALTIAALAAMSMLASALALPSGPAQNGCFAMGDAHQRLEDMGKPTTGIDHGIAAVCTSE